MRIFIKRNKFVFSPDRKLVGTAGTVVYIWKIASGEAMIVNLGAHVSTLISISGVFTNNNCRYVVSSFWTERNG